MPKMSGWLLEQKEETVARLQAELEKLRTERQHAQTIVISSDRQRTG